MKTEESLKKYVELKEATTKGRANKAQFDFCEKLEAELYGEYGSYRALMEAVRKLKESAPTNESINQTRKL